MMEPLSDRQRQIYEFIVSYLEEHDRPPTNREIGRAVGIESTGHVDYHLGALERKGYLQREANTSRGLRLMHPPSTMPILRRVQAIPIVGAIAAGRPIEASANPDEVIELSATLVPEGAYALRVRGKSMIEDMIDDGDIVIVQPQPTANNGDVVVALLTNGPSEYGEATLKRFFREQGRVRLQPANPGMEPIYVREQDMQIQGKVVALFRAVH